MPPPVYNVAWGTRIAQAIANFWADPKCRLGFFCGFLVAWLTTCGDARFTDASMIVVHCVPVEAPVPVEAQETHWTRWARWWADLSGQPGPV